MEKYTVKQARLLSGISIKKMAKELGMSPSGYRNKEIGRSDFYYHEAVKLSAIVGIPIEKIIFFTEEVA